MSQGAITLEAYDEADPTQGPPHALAGPPSAPLAAWEVAGLALPYLRRPLWPLLPIATLIQLASLLWFGWEQMKMMQFALAVCAWPYAAEGVYLQWVRGMGGLPPGLRRADPWLRLLVLFYGEVWLLGAGILALLLPHGLADFILPLGGLGVLAYCALTGVVYGLVWSIGRRLLPDHPLLAGNVLLLANVVGLLALVYYPSTTVGRAEWPIAGLRAMAGPYMLGQIDRWWDQELSFRGVPVFLSQAAFWIGGLLAVTLAMVRIRMGR